MVDLHITGTTAVFGIVADPTDHVRAPMVFNPRFAAHGHDAVMVPCHVTPEDLPAFMAGLRAQRNFHGLAVTIPHKMAIMALCDEIGEQGRLVGAVNTIRIDLVAVGDSWVTMRGGARGQPVLHTGRVHRHTRAVQARRRRKRGRRHGRTAGRSRRTRDIARAGGRLLKGARGKPARAECVKIRVTSMGKRGRRSMPRPTARSARSSWS